MYLTEVVQMNRIVKVRARSEDYDRVDAVFRGLRKAVCREVRMLKIENGVRVLLKYIQKGRNPRSETIAGTTQDS